MNFSVLAFVDTFDLAASLRTRWSLFKIVEPGHRVLHIRDEQSGTDRDAEKFRLNPAAAKAKWPEVHVLLARLKRDGERIFGPLEFGLIWLDMLDRGAVLPWSIESGPYIERHTRLHLALRTNPGAVVFSGNEVMHLLPGQLTAVTVKLDHAASNRGDWPRVHLVCDARKKDDIEDGTEREGR